MKPAGDRDAVLFEERPTEGQAVEASVSPRRRRRLGLLVAGVLAAAGLAAALHWWHRPASAEAPAELRDVPRDEGGAITFSDSYAHRIGLTFGTIERTALTPIVKVMGTVEFDPRRLTAVGTRTTGFVKRVLKLEGDDVQAGEALAEIESADLGQAQANLTTARAAQKAAQANATREAKLFQAQLTTARESEEPSSTQASRDAALAAAEQALIALGGQARGPLGLRVLRSPIAGHVVEAAISVGQSVAPDKLAFRVANLDSVWVELDIFERNVGVVRIGDPVEVTPVADSKGPIKGKVAHVGELIDSTSRTTEVRVLVDNRERRLRPGQAVSAVIRLSGRGHEALTVPTESITYVDNTPTLFVATSRNRIVPTKVSVGLSDGTRDELLSGPPAGTSVVKAGVFALKSELFR